MLGRAGVAVHVAGLMLAGFRALPRAERPSDAALVPAALATMHYSFGVGALRTMARRGAPLAALARIIGLRGLARSLDSEPDATVAPSLD
jgi:hypothetical protein